ncbi:hypothetical protein COCHEDRAFT_1018743, partial [Bipolaris maydis C5]
MPGVVVVGRESKVTLAHSCEDPEDHLRSQKGISGERYATELWAIRRCDVSLARFWGDPQRRYRLTRL